MAGTFIGGVGDFVTLFEPSATQIENKGLGYVVAYVGEYGGSVPYTAYNAKKSYINENKEVIKGFTKAIQKGLDYVHSHSSEDIALVIDDYFPDTKLNDLKNIIQRYKDIDAWYKTTSIEKKDFDHIQSIMRNASKLDGKVSYNKLVNNG